MAKDIMDEIEEYERQQKNGSAQSNTDSRMSYETSGSDWAESFSASKPSANNSSSENYSSMNTSANNTPKRMKPAAGILFLILFFGGIVGASVFSKIEPRISLMCFGLIFLSVGIVVISSNGKRMTLHNLPLFIFPLIGLIFIAAPAYTMYAEKHPENSVDLGALAPVFMLGLFLLVGLGFLILPPIIRKAQAKRCTDSVMAVCINVDSHRTRTSKGHHTRVYAPTWKFVYQGREHIQKESTYSNVSVPKVGDEVELHINPSDPTDFYREAKGHSIMYAFMGVIFAGVALFSLYLMFTQQ